MAVNKSQMGFQIASDSGSDRIPDRIRLVSSILVQNYYFRKAVETMTQVARNKKSKFSQHKSNGFDSEFFFQAACITRLRIYH